MLKMPPLKRGTPYTGITDFTTIEQVEKMLKVFNAHRPKGSKRLLHIGVMTNRKITCGLPTRFDGIFPVKEKIASIMSCSDTYNCLHYADSDHDPDLCRNLCEAIRYGGSMNALQLDLCWPEPVDIANAIHISRAEHIEVILQIGRKAFEEIHDPNELVERLYPYHTFVGRVLLDMSMGEGLGMDAEKLLPFARAITQAYPELKIVFAGGLGPNTMHLVEPLLKEYPNLSIDAQGKLRPSGSYLDPINWDMAAEYLARSFDYLK